MSPFQGQQKKFQLLDNRQVIGIIIFNHNMQNRQKLTHIERENGLKPHFRPFLALIGQFWAQFWAQKVGLRHFSIHIVG